MYNAKFWVIEDIETKSDVKFLNRESAFTYDILNARHFKTRKAADEFIIKLRKFNQGTFKNNIKPVCYRIVRTGKRYDI